MATAAPAAATSSSVLFTLDDPRLAEVSGIARGISSPGVFYVQNDSGDSARFFALDARTGQVRAVYTVPGAQNHDWEDLAVAPDARGVASVWLADIGDNDGVRDEVRIYRVDEPRVDLSRHDVAVRIGAVQVWRLRYPTGPVNAESLAVSPQGRAYVITKADSGRSVVYTVPLRPAAHRVQLLTRIGAVTLRATPSLIPARLQVLATGATLSADGTVLAVRTYTQAYVWRVRRGDVAGALRLPPTRIALPLQPQGEGVCIVGDELVLDSEGVGSKVEAVRLPPQLQPTSLSSRSTAHAQPTTSRTSQPTSYSLLQPSRHPTSQRWGVLAVVAVVALGGAVLGGLAVAVRRRRPRA